MRAHARARQMEMRVEFAGNSGCSHATLFAGSVYLVVHSL